MTQEVFGLCYEFVHRHGHYMELYKEEGLVPSALSSLQLRMLEANQIPRLLQVDIHEVDSRIRLQYQLASKRMLTHLLKVETLSTRQFAKLMYAIVSTLEESKNYMLNEANFVLKDNFIFIGHDWYDVYLTYVPLDTLQEEIDIYPSLHHLLSKLSLHVIKEEQEAVQIWVSTTSTIVSLRDFKDALLKLMDEPTVANTIAVNTYSANTNTANTTNDEVSHAVIEQSEPPAAPLPETGLPKAHLKRPENKPPQLKVPVMPFHVQKPIQNNDVTPSSKSNSKLRLTFMPLGQRARWLSIAPLIVLIAFLWQQYVSFPSTSMLRIFTGISLLLGDIGFVLLYKGRPYFTKVANHQTLLHTLAANENQHTPNDSVSQSNPMDIQQYYQNLPMHTANLDPSNANATVFLGKTKPPQIGPHLEVKMEGASKTIPIKNDLFTIGRGDTNIKVDLEMEAAGVSRIHAEIVRTGNGYQLRDAGSTNGTFLNEESLVIYQAYPLKDGDIVRIIRQDMVFRL